MKTTMCLSEGAGVYPRDQNDSHRQIQWNFRICALSHSTNTFSISREKPSPTRTDKINQREGLQPSLTSHAPSISFVHKKIFLHSTLQEADLLVALQC